MRMLMKTLPAFLRAGSLAAALCLLAPPAARAEGAAEQQAKPEKQLSPAQKAFDKDGDGTLGDEEKAAYKEAQKAKQRARFEKYDTDKDGKLSEEEKAAMKADVTKEKPGKKKQE